jgi:hypothetical protein
VPNLDHGADHGGNRRAASLTTPPSHDAAEEILRTRPGALIAPDTASTTPGPTWSVSPTTMGMTHTAAWFCFLGCRRASPATCRVTWREVLFDRDRRGWRGRRRRSNPQCRQAR